MRYLLIIAATCKDIEIDTSADSGIAVTNVSGEDMTTATWLDATDGVILSGDAPIPDGEIAFFALVAGGVTLSIESAATEWRVPGERAGAWYLYPASEWAEVGE